MIRADGKFDVPVPDYSSSLPHGMIGARQVWTLEPGEQLWVPAGTAWDYYSNQQAAKRGAGLVFDVSWARPTAPGGATWEVVAFGATMLRLQGLDAFDLLTVLLPHVPAFCPTCRELFDQRRHSAGLKPLEG